jgi:CDP-glucose 4,6-dehydratase
VEDVVMNTAFWKDKRVLVTGHTGFKGSWLCLWLENLGAEVAGLALAPDTDPSLFKDLDLAGRMASRQVDVRDLAAVEAAIQEFQPEIILHLAAQSLVRRSYRDPLESYATNVMGTANVLDAIRRAPGVRAAVVVTTDKVYENAELGAAFSEDQALGGYDPYSSSKACAEIVTASYRRSFLAGQGVPVATARAGNVIGGGDWAEDRLFPDIFRKFIFGRELVIRNPESIRPWQHVLDPLAGYLLLAERLVTSGGVFADAWNFGPDDKAARTVRDAVAELEKVWDERVDWQLNGEAQPHETATLTLSSSKSREKLGWSPRLDFTDAVRFTGEWYREYKAGRSAQDLCLEQIEAYQERDAAAAA